MKIEDLQPGDVLLFSGEEGSLISEAIMRLTGADVSHAAMVYREPHQIIEETPPAVAVSDAAERFEKRTISVRRLKRDATDMAPVLDAAQVYLNEEAPYAMSNLYLVGLVLIYKRFKPDSLVKRAMVGILKKLTVQILDRIHAHSTPDKHPMVCSQFVYQCFEDAGPDYDLGLRGGVLKGRLRSPAPTETAVGDAADGESTLERVMRHLDALHAKQDAAETSTTALDAELVDAVSGFARAVQAARPGAGPQARKQAMSAGGSFQALKALRAEQAVFVTPADLLDKCRNLKPVGEIRI